MDNRNNYIIKNHLFPVGRIREFREREGKRSWRETSLFTDLFLNMTQLPTGIAVTAMFS